MKHPHCSKLLILTGILVASLTSPPLRADCKVHNPCKGNERIVVLDFKTYIFSTDGCGTCAADAPLRPDEPVVFKIIRINPFRYAATAKINQVTFDALLKVPSLISGQLTPQETPENKSNVMNAMADMKARQQKNPKLFLAAKSPADVLWTSIDSFSSAADKLALFDDFAAQLRLWALLKDDLDNLKASSKASADNLCQGIKLQTCMATPEGLLSAYAQVNSEVDQRYRDMTEAHANLPSTNSTQEVEDVYTSEDQRYKTIVSNKALRDQQLNRSIGLFAKIYEPGFGELYSGPVAATGDQVEIVADISLSPEAAALKLTDATGTMPSGNATPSGNAMLSRKAAPSGNTAPSGDAMSGGDVKMTTVAPPPVPILVIPVLGRHVPTFSTGIFFTGLVDKKAQDSQTDRFSTALGAMVHTPAFSCFRHPDFGVHLSLGVALKDNNPIYVLGPSLIIGRQQRTVLTVGLAGGQVSRSLGTTTTTNAAATTTTPATPAKVFRTNFFFALTYNFGAAPTSPSTPAPK